MRPSLKKTGAADTAAMAEGIANATDVKNLGAPDLRLKDRGAKVGVRTSLAGSLDSDSDGAGHHSGGHPLSNPSRSIART